MLQISLAPSFLHQHLQQEWDIFTQKIRKKQETFLYGEKKKEVELSTSEKPKMLISSFFPMASTRPSSMFAVMVRKIKPTNDQWI